ncbi:MAG: low molecular weight protein-tyrosine-phosphatase, partial [Nocardioidaceae bacterium]
MTLPAPRQPQPPYRIAVVCLGNICRSPMAQVILSAKLAKAELDAAVTARSAGTGTWHVDEAMDRRAAAILAAHGYDPTQHRASHFDASWLPESDLILVMDRANLRDVLAAVESDDDRDRVMMFRAFDPRSDDNGDGEVPDPWYGDDSTFEEVARVSTSISAVC